MDQYEIAEVLREIAISIELIDPNPKKGISYRKAARSVDLAENFQKLIEKNELETLPGVGKEISKMILTLYKKGSLPYYNHLKLEIPASLFELTHIPGLTTAQIRILYEKFRILSIEDLNNAIEQKTLEGLKGFGPAYLNKLEARLKHFFEEDYAILYPKAERIAWALQTHLKQKTKHIDIAGQLRRKCEMVDEIYLLATSKHAASALLHFQSHFFAKQIISNKPNKITLRLKQGIKATLQIVDSEILPHALLIATGNQTHLVGLENEALKKGGHLIDHAELFGDEHEVYKYLGLHFIPPELREGRGEIVYAKTHDFSDLIEIKDLQGTFHCHTTDSDGHNTIEEMAEEAKKLGWSYIGISDHSKASYQANGLSEERLQAQITQIHALNKGQKHFKILAGVECDILTDGRLDVSEDVLKVLDFVIISIHSLFKLEEELMTDRLIRAIENPYSTIVGHLTGRLLGYREPYQLNINKVIDACIANEKIIELNAYPDRLDMDWRYWIKAQEKGLKCSINPDAHSTKDLLNCRFGVSIARKGWLKKENVINTMPLKEMLAYLKSKKNY